MRRRRKAKVEATFASRDEAPDPSRPGSLDVLLSALAAASSGCGPVSSSTADGRARGTVRGLVVRRRGFWPSIGMMRASLMRGAPLPRPTAPGARGLEAGRLQAPRFRWREDEVVERLRRRVARLEAEHPTHPGRVDAAPVGEEVDLLGREVDGPSPPDQAARHAHERGEQGQRGAAGPVHGLAEQDDAVTCDVECPRVVGDRRVPQGVEEVVLVDELQPRVEAQDRGDDGQLEVGRQRGVDARAEAVGEAQGRDGNVRAATREPADVALDLDRVLGEARPRQPLGLHVLGEHRRVLRRGAVDWEEDFTTRRCTLSAFWQAARSCMVPMTLTSFMSERPPAESGVAMTLMCTTVSTSAAEITFAMIGLRMSARTNSAPPRWSGAGRRRPR